MKKIVVLLSWQIMIIIIIIIMSGVSFVHLSGYFSLKTPFGGVVILQECWEYSVNHKLDNHGRY